MRWGRIVIIVGLFAVCIIALCFLVPYSLKQRQEHARNSLIVYVHLAEQGEQVHRVDLSSYESNLRSLLEKSTEGLSGLRQGDPHRWVAFRFVRDIPVGGTAQLPAPKNSKPMSATAFITYRVRREFNDDGTSSYCLDVWKVEDLETGTEKWVEIDRVNDGNKSNLDAQRAKLTNSFLDKLQQQLLRDETIP